jgi:hypothetical protein
MKKGLSMDTDENEAQPYKLQRQNQTSRYTVESLDVWRDVSFR